MPIERTITNEQKIRVTANPMTAAGNPAPIDGPIRATVISGDGSTLDGSSALEVQLLSGALPGDTTFLVEADADLGAGIVLIQDTVTLHVTGAQAAALGLSVGEPETK